jgi:hypothetical protein
MQTSRYLILPAKFPSNPPAWSVTLHSILELITPVPLEFKFPFCQLTPVPSMSPVITQES